MCRKPLHVVDLGEGDSGGIEPSEQAPSIQSSEYLSDGFVSLPAALHPRDVGAESGIIGEICGHQHLLAE